MTKRITILATCFATSLGEAGQNSPTVLHPGSTIDCDDNTAGLLVVSGKAKLDPEAKLADTTRAAEKAADERAKAAGKPPESVVAELVAAAVTAALAAQAKAAPAPAAAA
jgi:hypothetical protein